MQTKKIEKLLLLLNEIKILTVATISATPSLTKIVNQKK